MPVWLVRYQSDHFFPSLLACLVLPISASAQWTPMQGTQAHRRHFESSKMAANSVKELFRVFQQQLSILPSERLVSQASSAMGVACKICERSESRNQCCTTQWAERVDIHTCETQLSYLREALALNGLRSNLIASKFQKFSEGTCPQTPLAQMRLEATI